jgi:uncharacterized RDD family membrane protein YckC
MLAREPDWRLEVTHRLRNYRERRRKAGKPDSQTALPFGQQSEEHAAVDVEDEAAEPLDASLEPAAFLDDAQYEDPPQAPLAAASARMAVEPSPPRPAPLVSEDSQPLIIDVSRPPDIPAVEAATYVDRAREETGARPESDLIPVAGLAVRRRAAFMDALCLGAAYGAILCAFAYAGGRLSPVKLDAFVLGAVLTLLYAQYFTMFTIMGGATPGMMYAHLRVVGFDGGAPQPRQLIWRSFGYVVSAGTAFLGFLWAFWDEDRLTWHDRISGTYITSAASLTDAHASTDGRPDP